MNNSIAELAVLKTAIKKGNDSLDLVKKENFEKQLLENEGLCIQLEKELHSIREHNGFLIASLSDSNRLLLLAEERLSDVALQKDTIQIELNELRKENLHLHMMIKTKEENLNESKTALKLKDQQLDDLRIATKVMEEQMNNLKKTANLKLEAQLSEQATLVGSQVLSQMTVQNNEQKSVEQKRMTKSPKRKIDKQNISKHIEFQEKIADVESENVNYDLSLDIGQVTPISSGSYVFIHNSNHLMVSESVHLAIQETDSKINFSTLLPIDHKINVSSLGSCQPNSVGIFGNDTEAIEIQNANL